MVTGGGCGEIFTLILFEWVTMKQGIRIVAKEILLFKNVRMYNMQFNNIICIT